MNIIFFGTPKFSADILDFLHNSGQRIVLAVSQPDKPKGRHLKVEETPVKQTAQRLGIPVKQPSSLKDPAFTSELASLNPDIFIVVAYGKILPSEILAVPRLCPVNIHASLLPSYRGAAPIQAALMNADTVTGVTTIIMNDRMDAGDILLQERVGIKPADNAESLTAALLEASKKICIQTIDGLEKDTLNPVPQDEALATYAPKITQQTCAIDWNQSARTICCLIKALSPKPAACTNAVLSRPAKQVRIKITDAHEVPAVTASTPGQVITQEHGNLITACGNGWLAIKKLCIEGKNELSAAQFCNGYRIECFL